MHMDPDDDAASNGTTKADSGLSGVLTNAPADVLMVSSMLNLLSIAMMRTATVPVLPSDSTNPGNIRINCGGNAFTDALGYNWEDDSRYFNGGTSYHSVDVKIKGTCQDLIYASERTGPGTIFYRFKRLPLGPITIKLHFAEIWWSDANARLFDVIIEGIKVAKNYDVFAKAGGRGKPIVETYHSIVTNGTLTILFVTVKDQMKVSGIEIIPGPLTIASLPEVK